MSVAQDVKHLRAWLAEKPYAVVGGVGGCHEILTRVLDRLDELEWIVGVMRAPPEDTPNAD